MDIPFLLSNNSTEVLTLVVRFLISKNTFLILIIDSIIVIHLGVRRQGPR